MYCQRSKSGTICASSYRFARISRFAIRYSALLRIEQQRKTVQQSFVVGVFADFFRCFLKAFRVAFLFDQCGDVIAKPANLLCAHIFGKAKECVLSDRKIR